MRDFDKRRLRAEFDGEIQFASFAPDEEEGTVPLNFDGRDPPPSFANVRHNVDAWHDEDDCDEECERVPGCDPPEKWRPVVRGYERVSRNVLTQNERAHDLGVEGQIGVEEWRLWKDCFLGRCAYCGEETRDREVIEHFVSLRRGGKHDLSNAVPSCADCNQSKHARDPLRWLTKRGYLEGYERRRREAEALFSERRKAPQD